MLNNDSKNSHTLLPILLSGLLFSHCSLFLGADSKDDNDTAGSTDDTTGSDAGDSGTDSSGGDKIIACENAAGPVDDFENQDTSDEWTVLLEPNTTETQDSLPRQNNGRLTIDFTPSNPVTKAGYLSRDFHSLDGNSIVIEIGEIPPQENNEIGSELIIQSTRSSNFLRLLVYRNELRFINDDDSQYVNEHIQSFDRVLHAFWKVSFNGNIVRTETSSDGQSWILFHDYRLTENQIPLYLEAQIGLRIWNYSGIVDPGTFSIESINVCTPTTP